jgi:hypothetical protein
MEMAGPILEPGEDRASIMSHDNHDEDCPCMYRQVAVAGELYVPARGERDALPQHARAAGATPTPSALPYTGLHLAVGHPSSVIVSHLLSDVLPFDLDAPVMLLGSTSSDFPALSPGDYPTINLTDVDFEEVADLTPTPKPERTVPSRYADDLQTGADLALG